MNTCNYSPYVRYSLTRGGVCRLQFLLVLVSLVILRSESCGTHDYILLSQIRDSHQIFPIHYHPTIRRYGEHVVRLWLTSHIWLVIYGEWIK
jgi:hypothetical protein